MNRLPNEAYLSPESLEFFTLKTIKAHLKTECGFSDRDLEGFFKMWNLNPRVCCTIYKVRTIQRSVFNDLENPENLTKIMLACFSQATILGPMSDETWKELEKYYYKPQ